MLYFTDLLEDLIFQGSLEDDPLDRNLFYLALFYVLLVLDDDHLGPDSISFS